VHPTGLGWLSTAALAIRWCGRHSGRLAL